MKSVGAPGETMLVGVLKRRRDLAVLLGEHWYRMPVSRAPHRVFRYLAWYQPSCFGREGKRIRYYARVVQVRVRKRRDLLPHEATHFHADEEYRQIRVGRIQKLSRPIENVPPRRVSFGFTTLGRLRRARNILELYRVFPAEEIVARALRRGGVPAIPQYRIGGNGARYCLDFAIPCRRGWVAVECDNTKAHAGARQRKRDRGKNAFLRRRGWAMVRLTEPAVAHDVRACVAIVRRAVAARGGVVSQGSGSMAKYTESFRSIL